MKLKIFTTATVFGLLALPVAHAQWSTSIHGNIPFDFQVGKATFPAGEYVVSRNINSPMILTLASLDRKTGAIMFRASPTLGGSAQNAQLVFNRYGSTYFLREVWQGFPGNGNALWLSEDERAIASQKAELATPQNVEVASVSFTRR
jgi:hypothetical protein